MYAYIVYLINLAKAKYKNLFLLNPTAPTTAQVAEKGSGVKAATTITSHPYKLIFLSYVPITYFFIIS